MECAGKGPLRGQCLGAAGVSLCSGAVRDTKGVSPHLKGGFVGLVRLCPRTGPHSDPLPVRGLRLQRCVVAAAEKRTFWPGGCRLGSGVGSMGGSVRTCASLWFGRCGGKLEPVTPKPENMKIYSNSES